MRKNLLVDLGIVVAVIVLGIVSVFFAFLNDLWNLAGRGLKRLSHI